MKIAKDSFDVVVIGGGHAGIEAVLIARKLGKTVGLVTQSKSQIGTMHCNISIGGPAKGIVVRELDALGGQMGIATDNTMLQIKMLNDSKGAAVWSLRAQVDKVAYQKFMEKSVEDSGAQIVEGMVRELLIDEANNVYGVILEDEQKVFAKKIIICSGTFLDSKILQGTERWSSGPDQQKTATRLSKQMTEKGITTIRLKTGTPPRIDVNTIDFSSMQEQPGSKEDLHFSFRSNKLLDREKEIMCWLIHSTNKTHEIVRNNFHLSYLYSETPVGAGPRYCPSIEDKIKRFADKDRHQFFVEPESKFTDSIYLQGLSTSLPKDVQQQIVNSLPGFENAKILKYAYAIEYDAFDPIQLKSSLESKVLSSLFLAGQINGTSGYEEAAAQGLIAGINACLSIDGKDPFVLARDEAYIGVMINDLVTKGVTDPYRLLTSRAEHRLILRNDNAEIRLFEKAKQYNLLNKKEQIKYERYIQDVNKALEVLQTKRVLPKDTRLIKMLDLKKSPRITEGASLGELLKRPEIGIDDLISISDDLQFLNLEPNQKIYVENSVKYAGYIKIQSQDIEKNQKYIQTPIPTWIDYHLIHNLASEAKEKLTKLKPSNIYEAINISGINPSDIVTLIHYVKNNRRPQS